MNIQEQFIVDTKGRKTAIILSLNRYQKLMEDLHDLAVVAERRAETPVSLQEMKRRLRKDAHPIKLFLSHRLNKISGPCRKRQ